MIQENILSHCDSWSLSQWLCYLETIHSKEIDMGLSRIGQVAKRLNIDVSFAKVITVAGTNGKGTTCAFIENSLLANKHSVAVYSSPHIKFFNERLRFNKADVADPYWVDVLAKIEHARGEISLTYYEYTTLGALLILMALSPEFIILEVGLGGRLDATNIIDADIGVITSIDLDHQAFLGDTREAIGFEKAGIFRANQVAIIGDTNVPNSVLDYVGELGCKAYIRDRDFSISASNPSHWSWQYSNNCIQELPVPHIPIDNVTTALTVLAALDVPMNRSLISQVIEQTKVPGRTEIFRHGSDNYGGDTFTSDIMLDVGHNPHAARYLKDLLSSRGYAKIHGVLAMLKDKDASATIEAISPVIDDWYFAALEGERALSVEQMSDVAQKQGISGNCFDNVIEAFKMAQQRASSDELVLVFGSFFTVAQIRPLLVE